MQHEFPEIKESVRLFSNNQQNQTSFVRIGDKVLEERKILFADPNFFHVFTVPLLQGNPDEVLAHPNSVVLTKSTAEKYFGKSEEAIGKRFTIDDSATVVTGVCED